MTMARSQVSQFKMVGNSFSLYSRFSFFQQVYYSNDESTTYG